MKHVMALQIVQIVRRLQITHANRACHGNLRIHRPEKELLLLALIETLLVLLLTQFSYPSQ